jgi:AcrR family transcriptional regulator
MAGPDVTDRPLRADAERNRQRILAAAGTLFAERGLCVSLDDIAHHAGVGVGTVYRRFPDKDALIDALFEGRIREIEALARRCLAIEDPWEAFATLTLEVSRLHARDRGLKETLLEGTRGRDRVRRAREVVTPLADQILVRAQRAGVLRDDIDSIDMPLLHVAVGYVADRTRDVAPDYWERVATILLDGLAVRRDAPTPLPAASLGDEQLGRAMTSGRRPA